MIPLPRYVDVESVKSQSKLFFDKLQALHISELKKKDEEIQKLQLMLAEEQKKNLEAEELNRELVDQIINLKNIVLNAPSNYN